MHTKYNRPDFTTQDAATYKAYIDAMAKVFERFGAWFNPYQQDVGSPQPDMTVRIGAGWIVNGTTFSEIAAQTVSGFTIPSAGQNRVDLVVVDPTTGVASRVAGTAVTGSPSAVAPALPAGNLPICTVTLTSASTVIANSNIDDRRAFALLKKQPTISVLTAGTTWNRPTGCTRIRPRGVGGGGGGAGSGTGSPAAGAAGGATTFDTLTANGGGGGQLYGSSTIATGGSASGGDVNIKGSDGGGATSASLNTPGATGGNSVFGGAGGGTFGAAGASAGTNSGSGGGGGGGNSVTPGSGSGAAGGYFEKLITSPAASYSYAIGAGGALGAAGSSGSNGGNGAAGIIIVDEFYD